MNQTKKRLAIIKLAISMTDTETIQLQVLKLGLLKTDSKMREILTLLNEKSYARAQGLISEYIETPSHTILQRTSQETTPIIEQESLEAKESPIETPLLSPEESMLEPVKKTTSFDKQTFTLQEKIQAAKDKAVIDEFELFIEEPDTQQEEAVFEEVNYDALLDIAPPPKKMSTQTVNYDALLNVAADDVLSDNISLDIKEHTKDTFFDDTEALRTKETSVTHDLSIQEKIAQDNFMQETFGEKPTKNPPQIEKKDNKNTPLKDTSATHTPRKKAFTIPTSYKAISYIDQKFKNMSNQYPSIEESTDSFDSVDAWLVKISNEGYTEKEVEEIIKKTEKLSTSNKAEAAQLLLICAATESKYAQFRLARALFSGEILQKNLPEAFTLINRLAVNDDYPEAICDLAQFYEKGIGITKDKKKAEVLYKEAMDLGIHRAADHYERIRKQNKGFFSAFKK